MFWWRYPINDATQVPTLIIVYFFLVYAYAVHFAADLEWKVAPKSRRERERISIRHCHRLSRAKGGVNLPPQ
jgi:hypothetical protein